VRFNAELVREARTVNREGTDDALDTHAVGYTEEDGQVSGVVVASGDGGALADALADVLREKYDTVRVEEDRVVAERDVFDAEKARELGVEEGPDFGRLSAGKTVEIDGLIVEPDDVHTAETREFRFRSS
jgi:D-aminoacyl-tRNA deacylase